MTSHRYRGGDVFRLSTALLCVVTLAGAARVPGARTPTRVLFVGNSLTSANNLPALVEALAAAGGGDPIMSRTVAFGNYSLEDHWNRGDAKRAIGEGGWAAVVLQQGPSALPESRVLLIEYTRRFNAEAQRVGARTALYMVWPAQSRPDDFEGVRASYAGAARDVRGLFMPVGDAWRAAWRRDRRLQLYAADGFHPSPLGSYLAALVIYQRLTGRSPLGLPAVAIPPRSAALLQQSAIEANARDP